MAVKEVTGASFETEVINSQIPVVADFYADWCGPCKMLRPILDEIAEEREDIKVVSINIDNERELADEFDISSIPCVILFKDGVEVNRSIGLVPKDAIEDFIDL